MPVNDRHFFYKDKRYTCYATVLNLSFLAVSLTRLIGVTNDETNYLLQTRALTQSLMYIYMYIIETYLLRADIRIQGSPTMCELREERHMNIEGSLPFADRIVKNIVGGVKEKLIVSR